MEHLSTDLKNAVHEDLNIYAFGEGLPLNKKWVRFSFHHIESYPTRFINWTFFVLSKLVWDHVLNTSKYINVVNGSYVLGTLFHELLLMERKFDWFQTSRNRFLIFFSSNQFHINICKENHNIIKTCKINEIKNQ